jgi:hypothetical protein
MMKAELALIRERIAWTRRQLCRVDERISSLNEELWMTLNEEHYATAKRMISASSTKTYKELKRDPTANIERKICSKLSGFKKAGILSQTLHNCLRPSATVCPKFYGLPKIHKPNVPLRPIVASIGSPTYALAKYLAEILKTSCWKNRTSCSKF